MTPHELVLLLRKAVVQENVSIYRDIFNNTPASKVTDLYWKRALECFGTLSVEQKNILFEIIRQISVDTTSNILGIIDGVNILDGVKGSFDLSLDGISLNGDLQSIFLAEEERTETKMLAT